MLTFFLDWLRRGLRGERAFVELAEARTEMIVGRFLLATRRRLFIRQRGWFREPQYRFGVATMTLAFNACAWDHSTFLAYVHDDETPDLIWPLGCFGPGAWLPWRFTSPIRSADDVTAARQFATELDQLMTERSDDLGGPFSPQEHCLLSSFHATLGDLECANQCKESS